MDNYIARSSAVLVSARAETAVAPRFGADFFANHRKGELMTTTAKLIGGALAAVLTFGSPAALAGAFDRVMERGIIRIAVNLNDAPQSYLDDNNVMQGFNADVGRAIAEQIGVQAEFVTPSMNAIMTGTGEAWDVAVNSVIPTAELAEKLKFPAVYYYTRGAAAVHQDSDIQSPDKLSGKIVGVVEETHYEQYLNKSLKILNAPKFSYIIAPGHTRAHSSEALILEDLRLGDGVRLHGLISDHARIQSAIKDGYPARLLEPALFYEPRAVAIPHGDRLFSRKISTIIKNLRESGKLAELSQKWYETDYTVAK